MGDAAGLFLRLAALATRVYMRVDRLVRPIRTVRTVDGLLMECDTRDFVPRRIAYFGVYEHELTKRMRAAVQPGDTVVDIGANVGYFALLAATLCRPTGHVVAIEADPTMHKKLERNIALNPGITVLTKQVAVTATSCRVQMQTRDPKNLGANRTVIADGAEISGEPLDVVLGDSLHDATFIKLDIEGAEGPALDVILALHHQMSRRLTIAVEILPSNAAYLDLFRRAGFTVHRLANDYSIEEYIARKWGSRGSAANANEAGDYLLVRM